MRDPYTTLGLSRTASPDEVKASFRNLAKRFHPDSNPHDPEALSQFQEIQRAYALLKDPDQRFRYDSGLIDANGAPRAHPFPPRRRRTARSQSASFAFEMPAAPKEEEPEEALFSELFMSLRRAKRAEPEPRVEASRPPPKAAEPLPSSEPTPLSVVVTFEEALSGARMPVTLPSGRKLMMSVPAGVEDNQVIRLKNAGESKSKDSVLIRVSVGLHPVFARSGADITCELTVSLADAVLGAKVRVPTLQGEVMVQIPEGANTGTVLKLRGRGVPVSPDVTGDQLVTLKISLPEPRDPELAALLRDWAKRGPRQARR